MTAWLLTPARVIWMLATLTCLGVAVRVASSRVDRLRKSWQLWQRWLHRHARRRLVVGVSAAAARSNQRVCRVQSGVEFAVSPVRNRALVCAGAPRAQPPRSRHRSPGRRRAVWCLLLANLLVPIFYPSRTWTPGLDFGRTDRARLAQCTARLCRVVSDAVRGGSPASAADVRARLRNRIAALHP